MEDGGNSPLPLHPSPPSNKPPRFSLPRAARESRATRSSSSSSSRVFRVHAPWRSQRERARLGEVEASEQAHSWRGRRPPFTSSCLRSRNSSRPAVRCRRRATVDSARLVLLRRCRRMFGRRRKVKRGTCNFVCVCHHHQVGVSAGLVLTLQPPPSSSSVVCEEGRDGPEQQDFVTLCFDILTRGWRLFGTRDPGAFVGVE